MRSVQTMFAPPAQIFRLRNGQVVFGLAVITLLAVLALFAPVIATHDHNSQQLAQAYQPPAWLAGGSSDYVLGTDSLGRDIFSRLIFSARVALFVAVLATLFSAIIGVTIGLLAGYYRGWTDEVVMRLVDMWMSIPPVLLAVVLMAILGVGAWKVALAIILVDWTRFARVIRGEVFNIRERDFIEAARSLGMKNGAIIRQEVAPNVTSLVIILASLEMGLAVIIESLLSFVGLGVESSTPSWGSMISEGLGYFRVGWWGVLFPMAFLIITVLAFNLLGDGLRKALDPRLNLTQ